MKRLLWFFVPIIVVGVLLMSIIWLGNYLIYETWLPGSIVFSLLALLMTYISLLYIGFLWLWGAVSWWSRSVVIILILFLISTLKDITYWYFYEWLPRWDVLFYDQDKPFNPKQFNRRILSGFVMMVITSLSMSFYMLYKSSQYKRKELNEKLSDMALRFSSAHIYPHFVQSVTSSAIGHGLFGSARQRSMEYLHAVMRYVLKVQQESDVLVTLQEEWEYARKLLEVARSHYGSTQIQWDVSGKIPKGMHTVPMVLITFIENSLKHSDPGEHVSIKVRLEVSEAGFVFTCVNPLARSTIPASGSQEGGFGISNLQDRIDQSGFPIHIHAASEQRNFIARVTQQAKNETP